MDWQARVRELAEAQDAIQQSLEELKPALRNPAVSRRKAESLYGLLVHYMSRQNEEFYQELEDRYSDDSSSRRIIDFLIQDLKHLKVKLFVFEEKYLTESLLTAKSWVADSLELADAIVARFHMERSQLFPLMSGIQKF